MKKSLLLLSFVAIAGMASAQSVAVMSTKEDLENAGIKGEACPAATIVTVDGVGSFGTAYEDTWKTTAAYKDYQNVKVNDLAIKLGTGAVGNANPTFTSYQAGVMSAGAVFEIKAEKDGWVTVFTKMNPNKQYLVFEGQKGALAFTLGYSNGTTNIYYSLPHDEDYAIDFTAEGASKYFIAAQKQVKNDDGLLLWKNKVTGEVVAAETNPTVKDDANQQYQAEMEDIEPREDKPALPWNVADLKEAPGESTGFMTFSVAEGNSYYFSALGSKAACQGFVFTEGDVEPTIVFEETEVVTKKDEDGNPTETKTLPMITFEPGKEPVAGVESVEVAADENAPIYNMMGVRVSDDAKGILIQNGKKFIRK